MVSISVKKITLLLPIFSLVSFLFSFKNNEAMLTKPAEQYVTKNVIVVVIDGPRYSETWGAPNQQNTPKLAQELAQQGVVNTAFFNDGYTYTNAGHTAITTGVRQPIDNGGNELPRNPSFFQYWLEATGNASKKAWIVTSKDKLNVLADTKDKTYAGKFLPAYNCGVNGPFTGYREDSVTLRVAKNVLITEQPNLMLINFKEPDDSDHRSDWNGYLQGIRTTDQYLFELWKFLKKDPYYKGTTTLLVTNDHGRHLDGISSGFVSHGDGCEGCRYINFYGFGPDFKQNQRINTSYNQTDIPATIAELLGFTMPTGQGKVMWDLFKAK